MVRLLVRAGLLALWLAAVAGVLHALTGDLVRFAGTPGGAVLVLAAVLGGVGEAVGLQVNRRTVRELDAGALLLPLGFAGVVVGVWDHAHVGWSPWGALLMVPGTLLMGMGLGLRAWAQSVLGERFTAHVEAEGDLPLVREGPYGIVRHPSYTALAMSLAGAPLVVESLLGAAAGMAGMAPFLVLRIRVEEEVLHRAYGEAWEAYAEEVPALVPRPW